MPEHARTLRAVSGPAFDARAVWLDGRTLRWPGRDRSGRFRLHHARDATLVRGNDALTGADRVLDLDIAQGTMPGLPWIADGVELHVRESDLAALPDLHRGQLVITHEDAGGTILDITTLQHARALDDLYAAAADAPALGLHPDGAHTRAALWAPTARSVALCTYADASGAATGLHPVQRDAATGIWRGTVDAGPAHRYATWLVDVFVPNVGLVRNRVTDPYSLGLSADSRRSYIADLGAPSLQPAGWTDAPRPPLPAAATDLVLYELHVRDFSIGDASVPSAHRGKYLAFTDTASDGMRHLRALAQAGITDIHLLPVFDIATIPERGCLTPDVGGTPDSERQQAIVAAHAARDCFNWGYDPFHYTAPEGSYASDADDGAARILEFRRMVMALHAAGLRVGMDVVYNHTSAAGQDARSVLDRIVPGYYQRLLPDGTVATSTCCPNTATEHAMMERLMIDSAVTWARDYRIDSFRFDLMGHQPRAAMERLQRAVDAAAGRHVHLLGEGWNFGEIADGARFVQASQLSLGGSGIATFSDRARDAARGGSAGDNGIDQVRNTGWLNGGADARRADLLRVGLAGSLRSYAFETASGSTLPASAIDYAGQPAGYTSQPGEVVNYVENHDNQTLFDLNAFKLPRDTPAAERARVQTLGAALVAFSQGIAYFHAGQDILRSKSMDRNSFDSGDWFNRLDWTYTDNGFGAGLPPAQDNAASWELMRPVLADTGIKPSADDIAWTRDAFRDLLRIRGSSGLFRLRSADEIRNRLRFLNTGPAQQSGVIVGRLDGRGHADAGFDAILYALNAETDARTLVLPTERGRAYVLHPVHAAEAAADRRAREARFDADTGTLRVPARTAVAFVLPRAP
ncbi:alpha-1,6-glucosidase domain-containing protein [Chiayiivirga flava]|uniref:Pullulanase/glycogen debranching enzyme n=1 Tax=Chiayiivirga flava TaxID=659595 RepID=A0A7W8G090_9GAMM|nr:alpha-1,6-glucosidase domain-containing protein [Chiayiivirga flava]MBB5208014.1 pullulanase/glycogen debranching enzyme [Chiayiivirga flava]